MSSYRSAFKAILVFALGAGAVLSPIGAGAGAATADECRNTWGSQSKKAETISLGVVVDLRAGRHDCYDRLVIDVDDGTAGYAVQYVDELVEDGRGNIVPLRGGADLEVRVFSPAHDDNGQATYAPINRAEAVPVRGFATFRQVNFLGTFEGQTQIGLGVRARLPFRSFVLDGPGNGSRLVVDVAHRWPSSPTTTVDVHFSTGDGADCAEVSAFARTAPRTAAPIQLALDQLVGGPTVEEKGRGASSMFTADTADAIRSINLKDGLLVVDFHDLRSDLNNASTSCGSQALLAQLNSTVFEFSAVQRVRYQINGSCDTFANWLQQACADHRR